MSASTHGLVKDPSQFVISSRGEIAVKGLGQMHTYFMDRLVEWKPEYDAAAGEKVFLGRPYEVREERGAHAKPAEHAARATNPHGVLTRSHPPWGAARYGFRRWTCGRSLSWRRRGTAARRRLCPGGGGAAASTRRRRACRSWPRPRRRRGCGRATSRRRAPRRMRGAPLSELSSLPSCPCGKEPGAQASFHFFRHKPVYIVLRVSSLNAAGLPAVS